MPKLFIYKWMEFVIWSIDKNETRKHVHVVSRKGRERVSAKFWLEPEIELVKKGNFNNSEITEIQKVISENKDILIKQIDKFYCNKKVNTIRK